MFERDGQFFENDRVKFKALKDLILAAIDRTAVQSGLWSDPATWGGTVPRAGENVLIPLGKDVTYDLNAPNTVLGTVLVDNGAFRVAPTATTAVHLHTMLVHGGILQIGKPKEPVTGKFTMTFADRDFVAGDTTELGKQLLTLDARVSIIGQYKIPYARASAGITAGQTSIALLDDLDPETGATRHTAAEIAATWNVGDRVSIPTTSGYNGGGSGSTTVGTIASISSGTITLASGAKDHPSLPDMSNMSGPASGIRKKYTFKRTPWLLNETRTILFKSANPGTNNRRACLMFMGNHPPRTIGGHRDDLHRTYTDLGPDKDPRHEFRYFAMEGMGRTQALASPQVGTTGNRTGRWPFHPHHLAHWAMDPVVCQGLVLVDFNMWGYTHDDSYSWYDWCIARNGIGSAFTCIMDTEVGAWTRCFAADVLGGGGGGEFIPFGHGRDGHGYTPARQILIKEVHAANCRYAMRLNQNETDPLLGGYVPQNTTNPPYGRYPDREAVRRHGGWPSEMAFIKNEDPMMGDWDDFEFYSCTEGFHVFHRNVAYSPSEMRSLFHRWNIWRVGTPIKTPNYTWNYTWRDSVFSNGSGFWSFGDKLSGFVFWNIAIDNFGHIFAAEGPNVHNDGGGFVDIKATNIGQLVMKPSNPPTYVDTNFYDSANCLWATPQEAHQALNFTVQTGTSQDGKISGQIRDMLVGLIPIDDNKAINSLIALGYFTVGKNSTASNFQNAQSTGHVVGLIANTAPMLVEQNGVYQSGGTWYCRLWLVLRDRMTGDVFYKSMDRNIGNSNGVTTALLQANDIGGPQPQPDIPLHPDIADIPAWPDAVTYFLDPVHPVTYRAVTRGDDVSVVMEANNRFLDRAVGNDLQIVRTMQVGDDADTDSTTVTFDVTAIGALPANVVAPKITSMGVPIGTTHPKSLSQFNYYIFKLDRGRWSNVEGGWFESRLLRNGTPYTYTHHPSNPNPAQVRYWSIEPETWMNATWQLQVQFHNATGSSGWIGSNTVTIS